MKKSVKLMMAMLVLAFAFASCGGDDETQYAEFENGAIILNEGAYGNSNASITFIGYGSDIADNQIFYRVNGRELGDVLQHAAIYNGKIYMVLNNSGKVEVASSATFIQLQTITGLVNPRYVAAKDGKIYVTQWGSWGEQGTVEVFDANSYSHSNTIKVGTGAEGLLCTDGKIWVANGGGYGLDSTVMVVDAATGAVSDTVTVGYNPKELVEDASGNIWVICSGADIYDDSWEVVGHLPSKLVMIDRQSRQVVHSLIISNTSHPAHIDVSSGKETVYFGGGFGVNGIFSVSITQPVIPQTPVIDGFFYGFNIRPRNGDIYCMVAPNFTSAGELKIYSSAGAALKSYSVGIAPSTALFN